MTIRVISEQAQFEALEDTAVVFLCLPGHPEFGGLVAQKDGAGPDGVFDAPGEPCRRTAAEMFQNAVGKFEGHVFFEGVKPEDQDRAYDAWEEAYNRGR